MSRTPVSRREFVRGAAALSALAAFAPAYAWQDAHAAALPTSGALAVRDGEEGIALVIDHLRFPVGGRYGAAIAVNGSVPGPLVRLKEGQQAILRVHNRLAETTSIHWHGVRTPADMDGVPGVSFAGIRPGETFTYRFPVYQSGTYWAHSHSGAQELLGFYFPFVIDPASRDPVEYDRDLVVVLSDWSFDSPMTILARLKKDAGYYNYQRRAVADFFRDARRAGWGATIGERLAWAKMRMDPTDLADVTGRTYSYLVNGLPPAANWTGIFAPGERVRLRFIGAGAMTYFDIRIPGLKMTVVQADGQNVRPVKVDEFRLAPGETFDVVVRPGDSAYTLFAEALDRSGYARGTLAPRQGMSAPVPPRRRRPVRTMIDMGMPMTGGASMPGMDMKGMEGMEMPAQAPMKMPGMANDASAVAGPSLPGSPPVMHGPDHHGPGNASVPMVERNRLDDPGTGLEDADGKVLVYADLENIEAHPDQREPQRSVELHLTGNMDRYMWSFDGKTYSQASAPILFPYGERIRLILVNDTMMDHPIHLHGMWMELENGHGARQPRKHTINVKPAERMSLAITADAPGEWALHCHLLLHMHLGMFRVVKVARAT